VGDKYPKSPTRNEIGREKGVMLLVSECQTSGEKKGQSKKQKNNAAPCLCFLNYLAFLRLAADRADSMLSLGRKPRSLIRVSLG
jgi:hypothetical protein